MGIQCPKTAALNYHTLPNKGYIFKGLVVCKCYDQEPLDLPNGLALGCYQLSPEVWIYYYKHTYVPNKLSDYIICILSMDSTID